MTEQEFKDYIADEVLMGIKGEMQWEHTKVPDPINKIYDLPINGITGSNLIGTSMTIIGVEIPQGATIDTTAGTRITSAPTFFDSRQISFTTSIAGAGLFKYTVPEIPAYRPSSVRAYNAILNETLCRLGVADITQITDIKRLRDYGRREAWRQVMWATTGDYDYSADTVQVQRSAGHRAAINMFEAEDAYVKAYYADVRVVRPAITATRRIGVTF